MLRRVRRRACRNRLLSSLKCTSAWDKSPHCSRIAWGIVTGPLLVMRMATAAGGAKEQ